ncbi:MAG: hypothetical protein ACRC9Q_00860 [Bacteroidales bacterium]
MSPKCLSQGSERPMEFIYPTGNTAIILPKQLDGSEGKVSVEIAHQHENAVLFWHLDKQFLGQTRDFHQMAISTGPGRHRLVVVDQNGESISRYITVE